MGSFLPPTCQGYHNHIGGGGPPPPTVIPMIPVVTLTCTEWEAPSYRTVRQGGGEEATTAGGGGVAGDLGEGLPGLWGTTGDGHLVYVTGTGHDSGGRQLDGSGGKLEEF